MESRHYTTWCLCLEAIRLLVIRPKTTARLSQGYLAVCDGLRFFFFPLNSVFFFLLQTNEMCYYLKIKWIVYLTSRIKPDWDQETISQGFLLISDRTTNSECQNKLYKKSIKWNGCDQWFPDHEARQNHSEESAQTVLGPSVTRSKHLGEATLKFFPESQCSAFREHNLFGFCIKSVHRYGNTKPKCVSVKAKKTVGVCGHTKMTTQLQCIRVKCSGA